MVKKSHGLAPKKSLVLHLFNRLWFIMPADTCIHMFICFNCFKAVYIAGEIADTQPVLLDRKESVTFNKNEHFSQWCNSKLKFIETLEHQPAIILKAFCSPNTQCPKLLETIIPCNKFDSWKDTEVLLSSWKCFYLHVQYMIIERCTSVAILFPLLPYLQLNSDRIGQSIDKFRMSIIHKVILD